MTKAINIQEKAHLITQYWQPKLIANFNDHDIRLAKIQGEFEWHFHEDTDEVFIVQKGNMIMHYRDASIALSQGDMIVVPKNKEHKPEAKEECMVMIIEKSGTLNTGNLKDSHRAVKDIEKI